MEVLEGKKRVMICPLGWGLGHATRVIPVVDYLLSRGCEVIVAGDEHVKPVFESRYKQVKFILFPSLRVKFSKGRNQLLPLIRIAFRVFGQTQREQRIIQSLIDEYKVDMVISDNRYGLYSKKVDSVFITHQLNILFPKPFGWLGFIGRMYVRYYAERYTECWIPDNSTGIRVSGKLSAVKKMPRNTRFIGLLSRFANLHETPAPQNQWDLVVIASGPSPQREIFVQEATSFAQRQNFKTLILCGNPKGNEEQLVDEKVLLLSSLTDEEILEGILSAQYLICRAGYSTIMDLIALGKTALLVPTPGQTEQEYLSHHLSEKGLFTTTKQHCLKNLGLCDIAKAPSTQFVNSEFFPSIFQSH